MKPKERFINYALLSSTNNCEPNQNSFSKEDTPIDLSVKKPTAIVPLGNDGHHHRHFSLYGNHADGKHHGEYEHRAPFFSPPPPPPAPSHINDWPGRYFIPNLMAKHHYHHHNAYHHHPHHSNNLFPYLFINPGCLPPEIVSDHPTIKKQATTPDSTILDHYVMPHRLHPTHHLHHHQNGMLFPFKIDQNHFNSQFRDSRQSNGENLPLSTESSSSSSSSSPYEYHITDYSDMKNGVAMKSQTKSLSQSLNIVNNKNNKVDNQTKHHNGSHSLVAYDPKAKLKKAYSFPCLPSMLLIRRNNHHNLSGPKGLMVRSKSECNLHLIKSYSMVTTTNNDNISTSTSANTPSSTMQPSVATKINAPKKMFASNYYQQTNKDSIEKTNANIKNHEQVNENKTINNNSRNNDNQNTRFYRNYRKEVIECWDNERRDNESANNNKLNNGTNNILDLRTTSSTANDNLTIKNIHHSNNPIVANSVKILPVDLQDQTSANHPNYHHHHRSSTGKFDGGGIGSNPKDHPQPAIATSPVPPPMPPSPFSSKQHRSMGLPLDIYKQYYYYLMQEPSFASRAAVAVAETYAKLLSNSSNPEEKSPMHNGHLNNSNKSPTSTDSSKSFENNSLYETKRTSPDCSQDGSRTELRSADTTNGNMMFDRKRISRPLTGKHVRHGTGASPSTLISLRNMIQQRQKLREIGKFDCNMRYGKGKANKRIKRK